MTSFDWKKDTEDSIKDGLIITATTTGIFFGLKAANEKRPKASLDAMDILKLAGRICGGTRGEGGGGIGKGLCSLRKMDQRVIQQKIL